MPLPTENRILADLVWNGESGALSFSGVRYLLVRPETLMRIQLAAETALGPERAGELFYEGGFAGGHLSGLRYRQDFGLSERGAVEFMCRMGAEIGWGQFEIGCFEPGAGSLEVTVHRSPFAEAYLQLPESERLPRQPTCHLVRGVLGGLMSGLFAGEVEARETDCRALGAAACRFQVELRR